MNQIQIITRRVCFSFCLLGVGLPGQALERGVSLSGISFVSSGIDHAGLVVLTGETKSYSLRVNTFRDTGAYLATAWARASDAKTPQQG
jgi:hypothetical protein